jgi:hypothetical protein
VTIGPLSRIGAGVGPLRLPARRWQADRVALIVDN